MNVQFDVIRSVNAGDRIDRLHELRQAIRQESEHADCGYRDCSGCICCVFRLQHRIERVCGQTQTAPKRGAGHDAMIKRLADARACACGVEAVSQLHRYAAPVQADE